MRQWLIEAKRSKEIIHVFVNQESIIWLTNHRLTEFCDRHSRGNMFSEVLNHASPSGSLTDESGYTRRMLPAPKHSANCKVWRRKNNGLRMFFMVRDLNARAYNDILDDSVSWTLWQQFGEGPFVLQHGNAPMHKVRSIQKWFVEIGVEELIPKSLALIWNWSPICC